MALFQLIQVPNAGTTTFPTKSKLHGSVISQMALFQMIQAVTLFCIYLATPRYCLFTMAPSNISLGSSAGDAAPISDDNHPTQGIFTNEQKEYLNTFLEDYLVLSSLVTGGTKSTKVKWVKSNVYQRYIEKYNSAGPNGLNLSSLLTVSQLKYHNIN